MVGHTYNSHIWEDEAGGPWIQEQVAKFQASLRFWVRPVLSKNSRVVIFYQNQQWKFTGKVYNIKNITIIHLSLVVSF